jgi:hypothetical protein
MWIKNTGPFLTLPHLSAKALLPAEGGRDNLVIKYAPELPPINGLAYLFKDRRAFWKKRLGKNLTSF